MGRGPPHDRARWCRPAATLLTLFVQAGGCGYARPRCRIKDDPQAVLAPSVAEGVCRELGLEWKNTPLTPPVTLALLTQQVLHGNVSNAELLRLSGLNLTTAAYCTAKGRLPVEAVQQVSRRVGDAAVQAAGLQEPYRWKGHRTWHCDGSSFSMPDTPDLQQRYGQPAAQRPGCGFPVGHLLCLFVLSPD